MFCPNVEFFMMTDLAVITFSDSALINTLLEYMILQHTAIDVLIGLNDIMPLLLCMYA